MTESSSSSPSSSSATTTASIPVTMAVHMYFSLLPGAAAGAVQAGVGHPFDTIKTKMQDLAFTSSISNNQQQQQKNSKKNMLSSSSTFLNVVRKMYEKDGFMSFYRGVSIPLVVNTSKRSLQYLCWDTLKVDFGMNSFLAGAVAGGAGTLLVGCPAHVIKIHSQVIGNRNALSAAAYVYKKSGFLGFYSGLSVNLVKDIAFASCYLGLYDKYKTNSVFPSSASSSSSYFSSQRKPSAAESAVFASLVVWLLFLPLDTIKTVYQSPNRVQGVAAMKSFSSSWKNIRLFLLRSYSGLIPVLARAGPVNALSMTAYEFFKRQEKTLKN